MLPNNLIKSFDKRRLRNLLALFIMALAVPMAVLIWQAYGQLKWEAFHQYRGVAEELTRRIDKRLNVMIRTADARSFADYTFLIISGDPSANFVQRSPLSAFPVTEDLPGALGYFQVDTDGMFSTPLLPPEGTAALSFGISENENVDRQQLAQEILAVLTDNRLVQSRPDIGTRRAIVASLAVSEIVLEQEAKPDEKEIGASRERQAALEPEPPASKAVAGFKSADARSVVADKDAVDEFAVKPSEPIAARNEDYSQQVFDQLIQSRPDRGFYSSLAGAMESDDMAADVVLTEQRPNIIGKVSELKLDATLQKKSEDAERADAIAQSGDVAFAFSPGRAKRREQIALPESVRSADRELMRNIAGSTDLRISTFESEIDPFEFSLLDSGHFVLFRNVWRDGERYIQGLLVDQDAFIQNIIGARFVDTVLAGMSTLIVAYQDDVIDTFGGHDVSSYTDIARGLDGALLYRSRLTAPLNSLELIFSIKRLPPGAGASVLGWVTLVLAIVFVGGFVVLYRLGLSQINLARQQQDFVSAVSHELKTPLTSIRMYGEMLKEGWADEDKRQSYYNFIHDESERLSRLISNVLQLARITRNDPQFDLKSIKVGELMSNTESRISSQIKSAGFELRFKRSDDVDDASIMVDEDHFTQIIINLVDNAIKFSKNAEEKVIEVSSKRGAGNRILFSVRDFGPGIPKDQMKKIFQLFYRSESELTRETVGTGIGLAIVHQLTLAMNGSVDLINVEPGAEFRIMFRPDFH
ncbi:MAG: HAMP domain-containing histidine kinase [Proteobacteria bacterium]|nr:HAMP domain-containing histidine kinase [Pseudomonadota bacterium]